MKKSMIPALVALVITTTPLLASAKRMTGVVNLNTATAEELSLLPGVGPSKAEAILVYRKSHPLKSTAELTEVKGIGPKQLQKLEKYLTVQGPTTLHEVSSSPSTSNSAP